MDHRPLPCRSLAQSTVQQKLLISMNSESQYEKIRVVGKGSFGKVYLVRHRRERKHYCMKYIKLTGMSRKDREETTHEVKLMQRLQHPNIVGFHDSFTTSNGQHLCIVMTFCDGGDLSGRVESQKRRPFKEHQVILKLWQSICHFSRFCIGLFKLLLGCITCTRIGLLLI